jgi:hypothetical protein
MHAQGIVDTIAEPLLVLDESLCVQNASRSFFETFKVDRYETIGRPIAESVQAGAASGSALIWKRHGDGHQDPDCCH